MAARVYRAWSQESKGKLSASRKKLYAEGVIDNRHLRKSVVPEISLTPEYGYWLAGFSDGEACFHVSKSPPRPKCPGGRVVVAFSIGLRRDDAPVLQELKEVLGFGSLGYYSTATTLTAAYHVTAYVECLALAKLFTEDFPLRGKKRWDVYYWRQIVEWCCATYNPQYEDIRELAEYMASLKEDASSVNFEGGVMPLSSKELLKMHDNIEIAETA